MRESELIAPLMMLRPANLPFVELTFTYNKIFP
jgi:hypothetical protein